MRFIARTALLLVATLLAALVVSGLGSAAGIAPQAAACEKHEDKGTCHHKGGGGDKDKCPQGSSTGDGVTSAAGAPANKFAYNLCRTGPKATDVTGYFAAQVVASQGVVQVQGPVTCAVFEGKTVSFFYPFNEKSTPPDPMGVNGILIVATDGGPKPADDKLGFFIGPTALVGNCDFSTPQAQAARNVTALPLLSGQIVVTPPKKS